MSNNNADNPFLNPSVLKAASSNNWQEVWRLFQAGPIQNPSNLRGHLLHFAVDLNNVEAVNTLLTEDIEVVTDQNNRSPILKAAISNNWECVETMLNTDFAKWTEGSAGGHLSLYALREDKRDIASRLIQQVSDIKFMFSSGRYKGCYPLHLAIIKNNIEALTLLFKKYGNVIANLQHKDGPTTADLILDKATNKCWDIVWEYLENTQAQDALYTSLYDEAIQQNNFEAVSNILMLNPQVAEINEMISEIEIRHGEAAWKFYTDVINSEYFSDLYSSNLGLMLVYALKDRKKDLALQLIERMDNLYVVVHPNSTTLSKYAYYYPIHFAIHQRDYDLLKVLIDKAGTNMLNVHRHEGVKPQAMIVEAASANEWDIVWAYLQYEEHITDSVTLIQTLYEVALQQENEVQVKALAERCSPILKNIVELKIIRNKKLNFFDLIEALLPYIKTDGVLSVYADKVGELFELLQGIHRAVKENKIDEIDKKSIEQIKLFILSKINIDEVDKEPFQIYHIIKDCFLQTKEIRRLIYKKCSSDELITDKEKIFLKSFSLGGSSTVPIEEGKDKQGSDLSKAVGAGAAITVDEGEVKQGSSLSKIALKLLPYIQGVFNKEQFNDVKVQESSGNVLQAIHYIADQRNIGHIRAYINSHPTESLFYPERAFKDGSWVPIHVRDQNDQTKNFDAISDVELQTKLLTFVVEYVLAFRYAESTGMIKDFFIESTLQFCLEARVRQLTDWASKNNLEIKALDTLMEVSYSQAKDYCLLTSGKRLEDLSDTDYIKYTVNYIMRIYGGHHYTEGESFEVKSLTHETLLSYIQDVYCYEDIFHVASIPDIRENYLLCGSFVSEAGTVYDLLGEMQADYVKLGLQYIVVPDFLNKLKEKDIEPFQIEVLSEIIKLHTLKDGRPKNRGLIFKSVEDIVSELQNEGCWELTWIYVVNVENHQKKNIFSWLRKAIEKKDVNKVKRLWDCIIQCLEHISEYRSDEGLIEELLYTAYQQQAWDVMLKIAGIKSADSPKFSPQYYSDAFGIVIYYATLKNKTDVVLKALEQSNEYMSKGRLGVYLGYNSFTVKRHFNLDKSIKYQKPIELALHNNNSKVLEVLLKEASKSTVRSRVATGDIVMTELVSRCKARHWGTVLTFLNHCDASDHYNQNNIFPELIRVSTLHGIFNDRVVGKLMSLLYPGENEDNLFQAKITGWREQHSLNELTRQVLDDFKESVALRTFTKKAPINQLLQLIQETQLDQLPTRLSQFFILNADHIDDCGVLALFRVLKMAFLDTAEFKQFLSLNECGYIVLADFKWIIDSYKSHHAFGSISKPEIKALQTLYQKKYKEKACAISKVEVRQAIASVFNDKKRGSVEYRASLLDNPEAYPEDITGTTQVIRMLGRCSWVNDESRLNARVLHQAIQSKDRGAYIEVLKSKPDLSIKSNGKTPMEWASELHLWDCIIEIAANNHIHNNENDIYGYETALLEAVKCNKTDVAMLLIDAGACLNAYRGETENHNVLFDYAIVHHNEALLVKLINNHPSCSVNSKQLINEANNGHWDFVLSCINNIQIYRTDTLLRQELLQAAIKQRAWKISFEIADTPACNPELVNDIADTSVLNPELVTLKAELYDIIFYFASMHNQTEFALEALATNLINFAYKNPNGKYANFTAVDFALNNNNITLLKACLEKIKVSESVARLSPEGKDGLIYQNKITCRLLEFCIYQREFELVHCYLDYTDLLSADVKKHLAHSLVAESARGISNSEITGRLIKLANPDIEDNFVVDAVSSWKDMSGLYDLKNKIIQDFVQSPILKQYVEREPLKQLLMILTESDIDQLAGKLSEFFLPIQTIKEFKDLAAIFILLKKVILSTQEMRDKFGLESGRYISLDRLKSVIDSYKSHTRIFSISKPELVILKKLYEVKKAEQACVVSKEEIKNAIASVHQSRMIGSVAYRAYLIDNPGKFEKDKTGTTEVVRQLGREISFSVF